jgi:biotin carboxyl carrier protein
MLRIEINSKYTYRITSDNNTVLVDEQVAGFDLQEAGKDRIHLIKDNKSYLTELISFDPLTKSGTIKVNSNIYHFKAKDKYDELLEKLGIDKLNVSSISDLKAPMPGMVLKIAVQEGQEVEKGENLLVLEAMKMENIIKSPADLTIGSLKIKAGDKVEKNQILITFQ